jgi:hypothetical protein
VRGDNLPHLLNDIDQRNLPVLSVRMGRSNVRSTDVTKARAARNQTMILEIKR